jgi:hypothetical protein
METNNVFRYIKDSHKKILLNTITLEINSGDTLLETEAKAPAFYLSSTYHLRNRRNRLTPASQPTMLPSQLSQPTLATVATA